MRQNATNNGEALKGGKRIKEIEDVRDERAIKNDILKLLAYETIQELKFIELFLKEHLGGVEE